MCAILGVISPSVDEDVVRASLADLKYRGPDHTGVLHDGSITLGHNRLSIIDLDARSHQPFQSADKRFSVIFNGEVYNFRALRDELTGYGHKFTTSSDTEVVLASFRQWGTDCFVKFHGMFSLALYDHIEREIVLARDRFGEKPLFYFQEGDTFAFCSELGPLRRILRKTRVDLTSIVDFLHFGFVPAPKTIYEGVRKLQPGYYLKYSCEQNRTISISPYYELRFPQSYRGLNSDKLAEMFQATGDAVASEISIADVPLGAFLSGGVDSAGSVYFLRSATNQLSTFTAGFSHPEYDESAFAQETAQHLNVRNINTLIQEEDFSAEYQRMVKHYGEPNNDFSFIPTYLICKEAAKYHTVMISGDGADELFCGYPRYHKLKWYAANSRLRPLMRLGAHALSLLPEYSSLRYQTQIMTLDEIGMYLAIMSKSFQADEVSAIGGPAIRHELTHYSPREVISQYLSECRDYDVLNKLRYLDIKMTLADDMLVKVDRASMANSIEVRPFYLHPLIADFAFNLSIDDLVTLREDKYFLKQFFLDKLPKGNVRRPKRGFLFPLKEFISGSLRLFFDDCIQHLPDELINKDQISTILAYHSKRSRNYTAQLNSLMHLGYWFKTFG